jgi:hypothetical protein
MAGETMTAPWNLAGNTAHLRHRGLTALVDLAHPEQGLQSVQVDGCFWPEARLLGIELEPVGSPAALADVWIRGGDLVAVYEQTAERPYRVQAYWRAIDTPAGCDGRAVELQVSVQTSLLDADPTITTRSRLAGGEAAVLCGDGAWCALPGSGTRDAGQAPCWLWVRADGGGVYAEMVHPDDAQDDAWSLSPTESEVRHTLFQRELEKGVILRARVRGAFLRGEQPVAAALGWYQQLQSAPLPLTT